MEQPKKNEPQTNATQGAAGRSAQTGQNDDKLAHAREKIGDLGTQAKETVQPALDAASEVAQRASGVARDYYREGSSTLEMQISARPAARGGYRLWVGLRRRLLPHDASLRTKSSSTARTESAGQHTKVPSRAAKPPTCPTQVAHRRQLRASRTIPQAYPRHRPRSRCRRCAQCSRMPDDAAERIPSERAHVMLSDFWRPSPWKTTLIAAEHAPSLRASLRD